MKFLIDNALSPIFAKIMREAAYDVLHVRDVNMHTCSDDDIFDFASKEGRIIVTADTDFGTILAIRNEKYPSVIIFRRTESLKPHELASLLLSNISSLSGSLQKGSIVIIEDKRIRIRSLPIMQ